MYSATKNFLNSIKASVRRIFGRCTIDYTDPFIDQSISVSVNEQATVSYPQQVADALQSPEKKYASLDGSWVLDGSYSLAPDNSSTGQMGWWGSSLSKADSAFSSPYPKLTITFISRPIHSLKVVGDDMRLEYPVDFVILLYGPGDEVLHTETISGNTQVSWTKAIPSVGSVVKTTLEISRWSHPGRQVKILEFFTSIQQVYEGDDLISINLLEEKEVSTGSLPIGTVSANEIEIKLNNIDRRFDAGNTQSPIYQLLKANRRIKAWIGAQLSDLSIEYVPLGVFWSGDWEVPENEIYAYTSGRDRLELLRKSTYSTSQVQQNKTLYQLAISVLQDAGLEPEEYWVDEDLGQITVPYSYFESQTHREALRKIAEAGLGQVYCDRNGIIRIESAAFAYKNSNQFLMPFMGTGQGLTVTTDDYYKKNRPVKLSEIANYIEVETNPLKPVTVSEEVYRSNESIPVNAGERKTLTAFYNSTPCIEAVASLEGAPAGCIIEGQTYYAWGANIAISSPDNSGSYVLVINAKPLKVLNKEKAVAQDADSIKENGKLLYKFSDNPLIQSLSVAQAIADMILKSFKNPRRDISIDWRGNPALLLGDAVIIKESGIGEQFYVTSQSLEYDGALRANLSGRKI